MVIATYKRPNGEYATINCIDTAGKLFGKCYVDRRHQNGMSNNNNVPFGVSRKECIAYIERLGDFELVERMWKNHVAIF